MYNSRVKKRKIKKILTKIFSTFKFKTTNFSSSQKLTFSGIIIGIISLFVNWLNYSLMIDGGGVFNEITGFAGFLLLLIFLFLLFLIFSINRKEKFKIFTNTSFKDSSVIINMGILIIILSLNSLYVVNGLKMFSAEITYGKGIVLSIISGMIIIYSGIILKKQTKENKNLVLNDAEKREEKRESKDNMKLPF